MKELDVLYIHGFGSEFKPDSEKIKHLSTIGNVKGVDIDYTDSYENIYKKIFEALIKCDILVGTSMGGYWAKTLGDTCGMPYVSINPVINPQEMLKKYIGNHTNYDNEPYILLKSTIIEYPELNNSLMNGLILLDEADELLSSESTSKHFNNQVVMFKGGCHRFSHMKESLELIDTLYIHSICNGIDDI